MNGDFLPKSILAQIAFDEKYDKECLWQQAFTLISACGWMNHQRVISETHDGR